MLHVSAHNVLLHAISRKCAFLNSVQWSLIRLNQSFYTERCWSRQGRQSLLPQQCRRACLSASAQNSPSGSEESQKTMQTKPKPMQKRGNRLVVVGLGNPGPRFNNTRHNIGFEVATEFAKRNGCASFTTERRFHADVGTVTLANCIVHVVKPRTFMNNSGTAVKSILSFYKLPLSALLVISDDMSLEVGRVRFRATGSAGGHNGLKSIQRQVGSQDYCRLKVGVGEPPDRSGDWSGHVLGTFSRGDKGILNDITWDCMDIVEQWVRDEDVTKAMNTLALLQQKRRG